MCRLLNVCSLYIKNERLIKINSDKENHEHREEGDLSLKNTETFTTCTYVYQDPSMVNSKILGPWVLRLSFYWALQSTRSPMKFESTLHQGVWIVIAQIVILRITEQGFCRLFLFSIHTSMPMFNVTTFPVDLHYIGYWDDASKCNFLYLCTPCIKEFYERFHSTVF